MIRMWLTTFIMLFSQYVVAAPPNSAEYGFTVGYGRFSVTDPDGDTGADLSPIFALNYIYTASHHWRIWNELAYTKISLPYSDSFIGQDIGSLQLLSSVHLKLPFPPKGYGWLGIGGGIVMDSIRNRYSTDSEGFRLKTLPQRENTYGVVIASMGSIFLAKQYYRVGVDMDYLYSFQEGIQGYYFRVFSTINF